MKEKKDKNANKTELCFERRALEISEHFSLAKVSAGAGIFAVLAGKLTLVIDGEERELSSGELAFLPPRAVYCYRADEEKTEIVALLASQELLSKAALFENGCYPPPFPKADENAQNVLKILDTLLKIHNNSENSGNPDYIVLAALSAFEAAYPPKPEQNNPSRDAVTEALAFIDENIDKPISLDSLAEALGYTKNHLSFIFNKFARTNLREQLNRKRLALVSGLRAEDTESPFYRIVLRAGFDSQNTYYRALARYGDGGSYEK